MKKIFFRCDYCGNKNNILTQVSCSLEPTYLCEECYKSKYSEEVRNEIEKEDILIPKFIQH